MRVTTSTNSRNEPHSGPMLILLVVFLVLSIADAGFAQAPPPPSARQLFDQSCTACHGNPEVSRAADPAVLRRMTPERIYEALTTGTMRIQAQDLSEAARKLPAMTGTISGTIDPNLSIPNNRAFWPEVTKLQRYGSGDRGGD